MNNENKSKLQQKLLQVQTKLKAEQRIQQEFVAWLSLCEVLHQYEIPYNIQFIATVKDEEVLHWINAIEHIPVEFSINRKHLLVAEINPVHEKVVNNFPNHYPLRYVPNIPVILSCEEDMFEAMKHCKDLLPLTDKVVFFHEHFSPVIELELDALCTYANELIQPMDNAFICSLNFDWLLFKSLENEWRFGHKFS